MTPSESDQTPGYTPPPGYNAPPPGYGAPPPGYNAPPPGYPPQGYPIQPGMQGPVYLQPPTAPFAIVSLIASISGIFIVPIIGQIVGIIFGHIALNQIKEANGALTGKGMATAGLIVSYVTLGLFVLFIVGIIAVVAIAGGSSFSSTTY